MVKEYGFTHLSAGDLLRAEQDRPDSEFGELIKEYIREGTIVPMEVTVQLLENAMTEVLERNKDDDDRKEKKKKKKEGRFLIDGLLPPFPPPPPKIFQLEKNQKNQTGFPRKMDQAIHFEKSVCPSEFILFLDCPETIMESRLLHRGKTSGRADDNADSIRKRFRTFVETSMPVVRYFEEELGKVERVSAVESPDAVYDKVRECLGRRGFSI